jgi:peptidyl-tRNA hydrolase
MASDDSAAPALLDGTFAGRADFQQLIRSAIAQAAHEGWREMIWCDLTFEDWPLGERAVIDSLQDWSMSGRKLTLMAKRFDTVTEKHHRFVTWRKQWDHIIEARGVSSASAEEFPSVIWSPGWVMQRLQRDWCKGVAGPEPARRLQTRELLADWLGKSSPAFAATTLGL